MTPYRLLRGLSTIELYGLLGKYSKAGLKGLRQWEISRLASAEPVYFRGTSEGFPGSAALQRIGITPASTDPVVATIFATESSNYGRGVVYIATSEDLAGASIGQGNVLAATELEVGVGLAPSEFAGRAGLTVSASQARAILQEMGVSIPTSIRGPAGVTEALANTPRLTPAQISQFIERAIELGGR